MMGRANECPPGNDVRRPASLVSCDGMDRLVFHDPVAHSWNGEQEAGPSGVGFYLVAKGRHEDAEVVRVVDPVGAPDRFKDRRVGDGASGPASQCQQHSVLRRRQVHFAFPDMHKPCFHVDPKFADGDQRVAPKRRGDR